MVRCPTRKETAVIAIVGTLVVREWGGAIVKAITEAVKWRNFMSGIAWR